jgi:outer membrane protein OmpA-like peptidoglycan-associated protein
MPTIAEEKLMSSARSIGIVLLAGLAPALAHAQSAPAPVKISDQIRCELNGDCAEGAGDQAAGDQPVADRSWSWGKAGAMDTSRPDPARLQRAPVTGLAATSQARNRGSLAQQRQSAAPRARGRSALTINFLPGSSSFADDGKAEADNVLAALSSPDMSKRHFLVVGYTKAAGDPVLNRDLSRRRAQALVDYLVAKGMDRTAFRVRGYGGDKPLPGVSPYSAQNRRVEIVSLD